MCGVTKENIIRISKRDDIQEDHGTNTEVVWTLGDVGTQWRTATESKRTYEIQPLLKTTLVLIIHKQKCSLHSPRLPQLAALDIVETQKYQI